MATVVWACLIGCADDGQKRMGSTAIRSFWRAFEQHCDRLAEATNADAAVYDLLLKSLQSINKDLWFEFASGRIRAECHCAWESSSVQAG